MAPIDGFREWGHFFLNPFDEQFANCIFKKTI